MQTRPNFRAAFRACPALVACALLGLGTPAHATPFELVYTGTFNTQEALTPAAVSAPNYFSASTPFTLRARFDDSSPDLTPPGFPFLGFNAYVPSWASIEIAGQTYSIETAASNPAAGVAVALFDRSTIFNPGRYGVGLIADVLGDGAGIVGDFLSASPQFTVDALTGTTFGDYYGVGHGSGVCLSGSPPACPHAVTPWVLHDSSNAAWNLVLGNYEEDYPVAHTVGATVGPLNTAVLSAVPEPASLALLLAGLCGLGAARHRQQLV